MFEAITGSLTALREGVGLLKELRPGEERDPQREMMAEQAIRQIELQLQKAEQELEHGKAELAAKLKYPLCKCTFPPQVALKDGERDHHVCPRCKRTYEDRTGIVGVEIL